MDNVKIWNLFLEKIKPQLTPVTFNTWFKDLRLLTINDKEIVILVHYLPHKNHILNNYMDLLEEVFLEILQVPHNILVCLESEYQQSLAQERMNGPNVLNSIIDNENQVDKFIQERKTNLNSKYTFENFVIGDSNRFAHATCLAVAQNPGKLYNPLFLYGKSGLGKTHLMHAIGNYITATSNLRVLYITADDFMNDFINLTRESGNKDADLDYIDLFKRKYRDIDVLMIDDIQFLAPAEKSQQEFTNTFNSLYYNEKQIIICSDRSVDDLKMFADRLKTRFNWGLKVIINVPEFELKVKIIKNKIPKNDSTLSLSDEIIDFIASNCGSDVRNIEGAVTRIYAYAAMMGIKNITLENTMDALDEYTNNMPYTDNSIGKIMSVVANFYNVTIDDLKGKKRSKNIAYARQVAMYLCRSLTEESLERIGMEFGGKDHSTVIYAFDKITEDIKNSGELEKIISDLKLKMSE